MKTKKNMLVACFVGLALTVGIAGASFAGSTAGSGIVGSKHDMNAYILMQNPTADPTGAQVDEYGRVCAFCHTPHHAQEDLSYDYLPLWSRSLTEATFDGYDINSTFAPAHSVQHIEITLTF